jgi:hypothetical protein
MLKTVHEYYINPPLFNISKYSTDFLMDGKLQVSLGTQNINNLTLHLY